MSIGDHYARIPQKTPSKKPGVYVEVVSGMEFKVVAIREGRFGRKYVEVAARQIIGDSEWQSDHLRIGDTMTVSFSIVPEELA